MPSNIAFRQLLVKQENLTFYRSFTVTFLPIKVFGSLHDLLKSNSRQIFQNEIVLPCSAVLQYDQMNKKEKSELASLAVRGYWLRSRNAAQHCGLLVNGLRFQVSPGSQFFYFRADLTWKNWPIPAYFQLKNPNVTRKSWELVGV